MRQRLQNTIFSGRTALLVLSVLALAAAGCGDDSATVSGPPRDADGLLLTPVPQKFKYQFRASAKGFEVKRNTEDWQPLWPIGINFGLALPGRSPGDFTATREEIGRWLKAAADMGANTIRIYTVQSPEFYRELRRYNLLHQDKPLFLLQGAWLKEPEEDPATEKNPDYLSSPIRSWFQDEIDKVVDAVHGNRTIPRASAAHPLNYGRAWGTFDADCSPWLMGYLVGREMEPYTIENTLAKHADAAQKSYKTGKYFRIENGTAVEAFLVEHLDRLMTLQVARYGAQHPIGFSNWPTLDPLPHYTEPKIPVSTEDTYSVDLTKMQIQPAFTAGTFMSFHAYPYYPDFILYQPEYAAVSDQDGPNSYLGYLQDLRKFYKDYAVIISETGHPSSQGSAHFAPSGLNHGGYNENEQGWANLRTLRTVAAAGLDGACLFSMVDEWFKRAWITDRVSLPADRRRFWHNTMSPEQNFGVVALKPGAEGSYHLIDGDDAVDWKGKAPQAVAAGALAQPLNDGFDPMRDLRDVTVDHDAGFLHVRLRVANLDPDANGKVDWDKVDYRLAIDVLDAKRGDSRLLPSAAVQLGRRAEFQVVIRSENDVQLLVDQPYDLFGVWHKVKEKWQLYHTAANDDGIYNLVHALTNDFYVWTRQVPGTSTPSEVVLGPRIEQETGRFRTGREQDNSSSNFWFDAKTGVLELRIPLNLLNITDPSQRLVVDDDGTGGSKQKELNVVETPSLGIAAVALGGASDEKAEGKLVSALPAPQPVAGGGWLLPADKFIDYTWAKWDAAPPYHEYRKQSYFILRDNLPKVLPKTIALTPPKEVP
ncbi:MAG: hypothetical protein HY902_08200 [Deltaproteobacteria bacterium]|nr:hypothetical protein [Deltaproteobacteria bacterium]